MLALITSSAQEPKGFLHLDKVRLLRLRFNGLARQQLRALADSRDCFLNASSFCEEFEVSLPDVAYMVSC